MNFVMICTDQLRADCLGYAHKYPVKTPNIDALAKDSVCFTESYSTLPTCCPARQSILTGRLPEKLGALWNYDITFPVKSITPADYTWVREFKNRGYETCYIGKWHVSPDYSPLDFGYDTYISESDINREIARSCPEVEFSGGFMGCASPYPLEHSVTHTQTKHAIEFLEKQGNKPFHLRLDFADPHLPCRPSQPFSSMYDPKDIPQWDGFNDRFENKPYIQKQMVRNWGNVEREWKDFLPTVALYYGLISQIDDAVGRLIRKLKELELYDNTVILFTSDHGDMCGSHRMMDKHYVLYDDIVRVPFLLKVPGIKPSVCSDYTINSVDIAPTVCDIFDFEKDHTFDGRSMLPAMKREEYHKRDCVVATFNGQQFGLYTLRMIKCGNIKYIWNPADVDELYDLDKDPGELNNLIYDQNYQEVLNKFRLKLYDELKRADDPVLRTNYLNSQLLENNKF